MPQFSAELPLEVVKDILLAHYSLEDIDKQYILWYNNTSKRLILEPQFATHNEADPV